MVVRGDLTSKMRARRHWWRAAHPKKNATVKNFTSTDFLGPIRFDSPNGGTSNLRIKKNVNSPFNQIWTVSHVVCWVTFCLFACCGCVSFFVFVLSKLCPFEIRGNSITINNYCILFPRFCFNGKSYHDFSKLWQSGRTDQPTDQQTEQPTDQPTNRRTWGLIGKVHFQ